MEPFNTCGAAMPVGQDEGRRLSLDEGEIAFDAPFVKGQGYAGQEGRGLASAPGLNCSASGITTQGAKFREGTGVIMPGFEFAAQVNLTGQAGDYAVDFMGSVGRGVRVVVVVVGHGHEVGNRHLAVGRGEGRFEDVGTGQIFLPDIRNRAGGADTEVPAHVAVQDTGEDAGRVESREATPVYGAVGTDQRRRIHVAY